MSKYMTDLSDGFTAFKAGVVKNVTLWAAKNITPESIQAYIDRITASDKKVEDLKIQLATATSEAHAIEAELDPELTRYIKIAYALHEDEREKLRDYGLEPRKDAQSKPVPTKKLTVTIDDDTDGAGFVLSTNKDNDADMYEWYRGISADPTKTDVIPSMTPYKSTRTLSFVDDNVLQGQRVWYKVRATNAAGAGPWSESVSKVQ